MKEVVKQLISDSIDVKTAMLADDGLVASIEQLAANCLEAIRSGRKVLLCGNGGSASDAQHIAAELTGRFQQDRQALHTEALTVNSSELTAISNDYGFEHVFARLVEAKGQRGDVLIGLSTSGSSANVRKALVTARRMGLQCVGMTGTSGGPLLDPLCDVVVSVPSNVTARIQECHILVGHILCEVIESAIMSDDDQ